MDKFIQNFYNVIFYPKEGLSGVETNTSFSATFKLVCFLSVFIYVLQYKFNTDFNIFWFVFGGLFAILAGLFQWFLAGFFVEFVATVFNRGKNLKTFLKLTAYAGVPFIFLAPLSVLTNPGNFCRIAGILAGLFVSCYVIFLLIKSTSMAYKISFFKAIMLLAIPLAGSIINVMWTIGFFSKLVYICSM